MRILRSVSAMVLIVGLFAIAGPTGAATEGRVCDDAGSGTQDAPNVSRVFQSGVKADFQDTNPHDHVPDGWSASSNYSPDDCDRRIVDNAAGENGTDVLEQEIFTDSQSDKASGDVSIFRSYKARRSHKYRVTARVDLTGASGDFRGRLKVAAWNNGKPLFPEQFRDLCSSGSNRDNGKCQEIDQGDGDGFKLLTFETTRFPEGTNIIKIAWRARETKDPTAAGVAILDWIKYVRIR